MKYFPGLLLIVSLQLSGQDFKFLPPVKMGPQVNSTCDELSLLLSQDGKQMYFSRAFCPTNAGGEKAGQDIYFTTKDAAGQWIPAVNIGYPLNNAYDNAPCGLASDNSKLYVTNVYRPGEKMSPGISYTSKKNDTLWDHPKMINIKGLNLKRNTFFGFNVSANGKHIIVSKFKKDSTDAEDLFVSHLDEKGNWSELINLGDNVNSVGFETSPFLDVDDSTLYFSSNGKGGYGDADIFVSKRLDNTWKNWSKPQNLGNAINTKGFDGYFNILSTGDAYYISGSEPSSPGDIYYTKKIRPFNFLTIKLINKETKQAIAVSTVTAGIIKPKEVISKSTTRDGNFQIRIKPEANKYFVVAHAEGYVSIDENITIPEGMYNRDTTISFGMTPIKVGAKISLNHIYFDYKMSELLPDSYIELDALVELLEDNPKMEILIGGHTDNIGTTKSNQKLSQERVLSVYNYLVSKGLGQKRIKYKGYGSTKPIATNNTEEGRARNRRVEFTILKK